ncbi:MAG TPA: NAD(P)H-hydrate dehydratase [Solirubrobacteraceae bacterium]|nr:NAD(P)H-hydrate dehydratase [Solirubrobacteraceae bacterium]
MDDLPAWLLALPDARTMRAIDRWAIEERSTPSLDLMERAGTGVARVVDALVPDGPVAVVCGKGNNGGDGLVAARLLREAGRDVAVVCAVSPQELAGDARTNLERLPGEGPVTLEGRSWTEGSGNGAPGAGLPDGGRGWASAAVLVDALLGTGFQSQPSGAVAQAIEAVNGAAKPVVSVDVPSGVDASTGVVSGVAVRATRTVTFHAAKPGLWINPGKSHAGEVATVDIGIPRGAPAGARIGLITPGVLGLLPRRTASSTKFVSGHVLVVGGSRGLTGAPRMAAAASMRAGAGYVTACVPESLQPILASGELPELMTLGLPEQDGALTEHGLPTIQEAAERGGALALGPGLGRSDRAFALARALARVAEIALALDADGLNAHAGRLGDLSARGAPTVLTPHAGELGRLLELDSSAIERERLRHVRAAAQESGAVVVLKGDDTLIADPSGRVAVSPGGSPALATAGTGDVLTGVVAALLAQGLDPFAAAAAGVWLHALAGREAARRAGSAEGVIASDVIAALPAVRAAEAGLDAGAAGASARDLQGALAR